MSSRSLLHILSAIQERPWAITESMMSTINDIVENHIEGRAVDLEAVAARIGRPVENTAGRAEMRDHVAVIGIQGPIFRHADLITQVSGATSIENLATDFQTALDSGAVSQILLNIDSPGGQVDGVNEFADMVRAGAAKKPVAAYVDGMAASGAYWIAAAAPLIIANETSLAGSIGVVASMTDKRAAQERQGVKRYEIVSSQSPYKRPDPATEAGRAQILEIVDEMAGTFIKRVAAFRGTTVDNVMANYGQGKILPARKALAAGMIDEIGSFEPLVARLAAESSPRAFSISVKELPMADVNTISTAAPVPTVVVPAPGDYAVNSTVSHPPEPVAPTLTISGKPRIAAILRCPEAAGRRALAEHLALDTDVDVDTARSILKASPVEAIAAPVNPLANAMAAVPNPKVGVGTDATEDTAEAEAARVVAFVPKSRRAG